MLRAFAYQAPRTAEATDDRKQRKAASIFAGRGCFTDDIRCGKTFRMGLHRGVRKLWLERSNMYHFGTRFRGPFLKGKTLATKGDEELAARLQFRATGVPAPRAERDHNNLLGSAIYGARRLARRSVANSTGHIRADTLRFGRSLGAGVNIRYPRQPAVLRTDFRTFFEPFFRSAGSIFSFFLVPVFGTIFGPDFGDMKGFVNVVPFLGPFLVPKIGYQKI